MKSSRNSRTRNQRNGIGSLASGNSTLALREAFVSRDRRVMWNESPTETPKVHRNQHQLITKQLLCPVAHPLKQLQMGLPCPAKGVMSTVSRDWLFSVANDPFRLFRSGARLGTRASLPSLYMHSLLYMCSSILDPFSVLSLSLSLTPRNSAPSVEASLVVILLL
jgi:hypothetical protein